MKKGYIYSLNDPRTDHPKYIGFTFYLDKRIKAHINSSEKTHKGNWIRSLKQNGLLPKVEILDEFNEVDIKFWEQYYISLYKSWGFKLTNGTFGGDGTLGYKYTKEQIEHNIRVKRERGTLYSGALKVAEINKKNGVYDRARDRMKKNNPNKCKGIPIIQYSIDGAFIKEWESAKEVALNLNIPRGNITHCCKGRYKSSYGFIFKYKDEQYSNKIKPCSHLKSGKIVLQYSLDGVFLREWKNAAEASIESGISLTYIRSACNGFYKKAGGYLWKYKESINI